MRSLVPFKSQPQEVAPLTGRELLPKAVDNGLKDLMIGFAAPAQVDDDKLRLVRLYHEAISDFDPAIAAAAIRRLKFHNPRNPFRPTAQDVFEACVKKEKVWKRRTHDYFLGRSGEWAYDDDIGGAPLTPECTLLPVTIVNWLRTVLADEDAIRQAKQLDKEQLERIPSECFPTQTRENVLAHIVAREADERRCSALFASIENDRLRAAAERVVERGKCKYSDLCKRSDQEILELAHIDFNSRRQSLAEYRARKGAYAWPGYLTNPERQALIDTELTIIDEEWGTEGAR